MKNLILASSVFLAVTYSRLLFAADAPAFAGEYADKRFLSGQAVFQMSIEQHGNTASIWFSAGYSDGHGSSPEGEGPGKITGNGTLEFTFKDGEGNSGSGTITHSGDGIIVSIKPTHVVDPRCLVYYKQNIHLKHAAKK